ncbi:ATP-binding cassette domain-containing protein [Mycobacterium decipiens]|uniref:ABC transporter domain-containing protein n=1 Tax=Mycobacterium decipiens TaxID=1430326 RepID=A0A1X2LQ54_9MYCO|nr:ATP-binding cassette domain-containing protein [Mycobacterium decipiens]OSC38154.1 hypothetical protein B8W66_20675 [Mycobacterium decipiens]
MSNAFPLTVWVESMRYVFPPGRDVIVGGGGQCDIRLDRLGPVHRGPAWRSIPDLVLRFTGTHWVAIDRSRTGIYVDGARMSTVDIRDGQAITIGDPQRGPRLVFQISGPPPAPSPPEHSTLERPTKPIRLPTAAGSTPPPPPDDEQQPSRSLVERMTDATRKLLPARPVTEAGEVVSPTNRLPLKPGARTIGVAAYRLGLNIDGHELLSNVSFTAQPGSLIAVVGPSDTRNSALIEVLAGTRPRSSGVLTVDGHDAYAEPESMRSRIGIVPRIHRLHPHLTVGRVLDYAARLRLPPNTSPDNRRRVVNQVLDELELTPHRKTRVAKLSPEAHRCAALAIELVTRPSLLVVDEPSAALDAAQEHHVMAVLRRQADLGCVVVVATTSLVHLNMCDQVLLLTPAGTMAFAGAPVQIESAMGTTDWSEVFAQVAADPDGTHQAFLTRQQAVPAAPAVAAPEPPPTELALKRQFRLIVRRQARLLFADRRYFLFLALLPVALGALTLLIPGDSGLRADPSGTNPHEAVEILAALNIAAVILGLTLTIRDLVGERRIFSREQSVGLSTFAYLAGKILVFSVAAAIQTAILTTIVVAGKGGPPHDAVLLPNPGVELYVSVAATGIVSAIAGLALSSLGCSLREVLPLLVPVILASLLFAGGLLPLVGTWGFDQISWLIPAHWGFAASASTVDLRRVDDLAADDGLWAHYVGWWAFDMVMLVVLGAALAGFVWYRLRPATTQTTRTA